MSDRTWPNLKLPEGAEASSFDDPRVYPRAEWGEGPWQHEPDRVEWRLATLPGLVLLAVRGPSGGWCGYVGVPPGHPAHRKDYGEIAVSVHGGLTYAAPCQEGTDAHICHVPRAGEAPDVWWLGFDCGHARDYSPAHEAINRRFDLEFRAPEYLRELGMPLRVYRHFDYVRGEVEDLAVQLKAMEAS